jgi:hypothetical protein
MINFRSVSLSLNYGSQGHGDVGIFSVRDHAEWHGDDWEIGYDRIFDQPLGDWGDSEDDDPEVDPEDHAG